MRQTLTSYIQIDSTNQKTNRVLCYQHKYGQQQVVLVLFTLPCTATCNVRQQCSGNITLEMASFAITFRKMAAKT